MPHTEHTATERVTPEQVCSMKNVTKTEIYWGAYRIRLFVFLTLLRIFVRRLKILFCINHYFLGCIFKYRTSSRVNYELEMYEYHFYSNNLRSNSTKNRTSATTPAEGKCVLVRAFIGH